MELIWIIAAFVAGYWLRPYIEVYVEAAWLKIRSKLWGEKV